MLYIFLIVVRKSSKVKLLFCQNLKSFSFFILILYKHTLRVLQYFFIIINGVEKQNKKSFTSTFNFLKYWARFILGYDSPWTFIFRGLYHNYSANNILITLLAFFQSISVRYFYHYTNIMKKKRQTFCYNIQLGEIESLESN